MTFQSLKKRALEAGMTKAEFHAMKKSNSDHQLRAGLLLEYLDQHLNAEGKAELEASYPDSFVKIEEQSPHPEVVHWAQGVTEVRDCKALIELAGAVPQGEPALMIMETWNQVILPTITEHFKGLRIGKIHHMVKRSKSLDITSKLRASEVWDQSWQTELDHAVEAACPK